MHKYLLNKNEFHSRQNYLKMFYLHKDWPVRHHGPREWVKSIL